LAVGTKEGMPRERMDEETEAEKEEKG